MNSEAALDEFKGRFDPDADDALRPLLLAAANGCRMSFAQLYVHTHRRIFGIVLRIVRHRAEAEEVLQDIYVKVWSRSHQFDSSRGIVIYWLASIAHRASIDASRRASRRPSEVSSGLDDADPYSQLVSSNTGPVEECERLQTQRLVRAQIEALPAEQKEALVLAFVDGLSHPEIAAKLACPLGTIKSRVRRALMSMRPQLQALQ